VAAVLGDDLLGTCTGCRGLIGRLRGGEGIREFIGRASGRVKNNTCTQRWGGMGFVGLGLGLALGVVGERWARENTYQYLVQSSSSPQRLRSAIMSLPLLVLSGQQLRDASLARRIFGLVFVLHYRHGAVSS